MNLLVNSQHGVYAWKVFAEQYRATTPGIAPEYWVTLLAGPEAEHYWETADYVESNARRGALRILQHDGDIWEGTYEEFSDGFSEDYDAPPI